MAGRKGGLLGAGLAVGMPLCLLFAAGCSKPQETAGGPPGPPPGGRMRGPGGGPGGGGPGRGPGKPLTANASGAEIYQAKCGCHGPEGRGGGATAVNNLAGRADADLYKIIHDGRGKMPAFGTQLTEAQINKAVAHLKSFKPG